MIGLGMGREALCVGPVARLAQAFSLCTALMLIGFALAPAFAIAGEGSAPEIVSTEWGIGGEVSVGASINPEGLLTSYEIKLACASPDHSVRV